ncbi:MAG: sodium-dependent bicarbonate transport family permease [Erythrobacter sp.]|uniref:sodium-dependent bicarbonate transport family permease n=1 Tax=Erythrobacter sp. TaxID=1042 RepID=UPI00261A9540|nr:sodium-dependent bicarbonate transport family permease [Erythrobacter sp.]MDJ0977267.1 sodium-dependent bicarbonate transport family permease [Erythrobacter sp.]
MELLLDFAQTFATQLQKPALAFLLGGMALAAFGSKLNIPDSIYRFIVFMLLIRIGIEGGIEIRNAEISEIALPALMAIVIGVVAVLLGRVTLAALPSVKTEDGLATAGLFGAVSASTMAAGMLTLEQDNVFFEAWVPALYPFMDTPALIVAIVLASFATQEQSGGGDKTIRVWPIIKDSLQSSALSALILGLVLGLITRPDPVYEEFYDPLFSGFLSVLMLIMGIEAWSRLSELAKVAHWFAVYAIIGPLVNGFIGFGLGYLAHIATGFSPGGVILLAIIAASNSDISGPPTLRAGIPTANPSAFIGSSTAIGTPIAIAVCIPLFLALGKAVFSL